MPLGIQHFAYMTGSCGATFQTSSIFSSDWTIQATFYNQNVQLLLL